jgi:hypothetical protein
MVSLLDRHKRNDLFAVPVIDDPAWLTGQFSFEYGHPLAAPPAETGCPALDLRDNAAERRVIDTNAEPFPGPALRVDTLRGFFGQAWHGFTSFTLARR